MVSNTGMVIVAVFPTFSLSYTSLPDSVAAVSTGLVSKICSSSATAGSPKRKPSGSREVRSREIWPPNLTDTDLAFSPVYAILLMVKVASTVLLQV